MLCIQHMYFYTKPILVFSRLMLFFPKHLIIIIFAPLSMSMGDLSYILASADEKFLKMKKAP